MPKTFGFELEVASGAEAALAYLHSEGVSAVDHFHRYHCSCSDCDHADNQDDAPLLTAQQDCTADGEFITRITEFGSDRHRQVIKSVSAAVQEAGCEVHGHDVGFHVHVQRDADVANRARLVRIMGRYQDDLVEIAAGASPRVRGYNSPIRVVDTVWRNSPETLAERGFEDYGMWSGSYLSTGDSGVTWEFRLWNATLAAWRMNLAVGLSVAMVLAAEDGVHVRRNDMRPFVEVVKPYLDPATWAGYIRQRDFRGGTEGVDSE